MSEQHPEQHSDDGLVDSPEDNVEEVPTDEAGHPEPEAVDHGSDLTPTTGHPAVDEVLRSLDDLDGRPVDEHVAAFEKAHEELRRALSSAGEDQD
jgi:hypothetical protein